MAVDGPRPGFGKRRPEFAARGSRLVARDLPVVALRSFHRRERPPRRVNTERREASIASARQAVGTIGMAPPEISGPEIPLLFQSAAVTNRHGPSRSSDGRRPGASAGGNVGRDEIPACCFAGGTGKLGFHPGLQAYGEAKIGATRKKLPLP